MPEAKSYRVLGTRNFKGHEPGSVFTAALEQGQAQRAIARGQIAVDTASGPSLESKSREELDALASAAGVVDAEGLKDKAAVIEAIRESEQEE